MVSPNAKNVPEPSGPLLNRAAREAGPSGPTKRPTADTPRSRRPAATRATLERGGPGSRARRIVVRRDTGQVEPARARLDDARRARARAVGATGAETFFCRVLTRPVFARREHPETPAAALAAARHRSRLRAIGLLRLCGRRRRGGFWLEPSVDRRRADAACLLV